MASILLLAFMASSFCRAVIVMDYYANTGVYAKNCENKARPKMRCNGKCQMMKRLAAEEEQNTSGNNTAKIRIQELVFIDEMNKPVLPRLAYVQLSYNEELPILKYSSPIVSIFHPPSIG